MTPQQARALAYLRDFTAMNGYCPSYDEIARHIGMKSKTGIYRVVHALEERGHIRRIPNRARAIEVVMPRTVTLNHEICGLVDAYARVHRINRDTAANELLRSVLVVKS